MHGGQKRASDPLELELQEGMSYCVGAGNQTQGLCSSTPCLPCPDEQLSLFICMRTVFSVSLSWSLPFIPVKSCVTQSPPQTRSGTAEIMLTSGKSFPVSVLTSVMLGAPQ